MKLPPPPPGRALLSPRNCGLRNAKPRLMVRFWVGLSLCPGHSRQKRSPGHLTTQSTLAVRGGQPEVEIGSAIPAGGWGYVGRISDAGWCSFKGSEGRRCCRCRRVPRVAPELPRYANTWGLCVRIIHLRPESPHPGISAGFRRGPRWLSTPGRGRWDLHH